MNLKLVGLSYKTASVEVREKLHLDPDAVPRMLKRLLEAFPEAVVFSTCNRFEVVVWHDSSEDRSAEILEIIGKQQNIHPSILKAYCYCLSDYDAIHHVFRVASSLDSMVVGESQILGQMKQFFTLAQEKHSIGPALHSLLQTAFMVAKKVRTETAIATNFVSVSSVAVDQACRVFNDLNEKQVLIIGAGKMGLLSIQQLRKKGVKNVVVTNRTFEKAVHLAQQLQADAVPFEQLHRTIADSDIVISSTGASNFILRKEEIQKVMAIRSNRPLLMIDIAVPRNLDPEIGAVHNVFLYDIDDLKSRADNNKKERHKEAEKAEHIVARESEVFWNKWQAQQVAPTIRKIQSSIDAIRDEEVQSALSILGMVTPQQRQAVERLAARLADKILQSSYSELRQLAGQADGTEKIRFIERLFELER